MTGPSITRQKMIEEATRRGWKVSYFDSAKYYYEITTPEGKSCVYRGSMPQDTPWFGHQVAKHKVLTSEYLQSRGFMLPPFLLAADDAAAEAFLQAYHPIVVKPEDAAKSQGVAVGVETVEQLHAAITEAKHYSDRVILQKQLVGKLYRVLLLGGRFCAAMYRRAAFVTGDGEHTIRELIAEKNASPLRTDDGNPLTTISIKNAAAYIGPAMLDTIPARGVDTILDAVDSLSRGGEAADVTDVTHADYVRLSEEIVRTLALPACGLDIMMPDISQPLAPGSIFPLLEVNSLPGFKMHYYPTAGGKPRNVAATLLDVTLGKV